MDSTIDKNAFRQRLRQQRQSLSEAEQLSLSLQICGNIADSPVFTSAQHIAFYTPVNGEANPLPLKDGGNKKFYLPILSPTQKNHLFFVKIDQDTKYQNNIYSIPEPVYQQSDVIDSDDLDLVIMPLVAADREGNRMGMGGGYYDRTFAFKMQTTNLLKPSPVLIGFCYDFQVVDKLERENWDVPLDYLATNTEFLDMHL